MFVIYLFLVTVRCTTAIGVVPIPSVNAKFTKNRFDDFSEKFLLPEDFIYANEKPVEIPTDELLDSVQNSQLFEGDIVGISNIDGSTVRRFRDDPIVDEETIFKKPGDIVGIPNIDGSTVRRFRDDPIVDEETIFKKPYDSALNLFTYPEKLWSDGIVPYMLEEGMNSDQRAAIAQAFDEYKQKTCIRFVPREDGDEDYIYIKRNSAFGCSSYVGRAGGNQTVSLEVDKCFSKGIIAHELMHALGFFHEHSRTDRDKYVDIQEENIRPGMMRNFEKYTRKIIDPLGMPYDYDSVMHYHKLAFSRNGKPTIVPKNRSVEIGQRYKLSDIDAEKVNRLYDCEDYGTITTVPTTSTASTTTSTSTSTSTTTITSASKTLKCEDLNGHCKLWQELGHCEHSRKYMSHYCRKSCHMCYDESITIAPYPYGNKKVRGRGRGGTAERGSSGVGKEIPREKCTDKNLFCGYWAKIGECNGDSKFMKIFCKASCGRC
ncbi:shTK domain protein [Dictyocaulus viviparus]|uniref:Metalloendopeptidase n=1 Tax=Dictyocaulus viviparus TaxID=29172 RepID=A0A0D8XGI3_DICVI|nr:shTK domain protein [Dictyocaulus viviparus]